jgi:hypothetical protein
VDLLELLPLLTSERLGAAPEPLLRALFERFQLQVRYHKPQNRATVRVALSDDSLDGLLTSVQDIEGGAARQDLAVSSAGAVSLAGGAPRGALHTGLTSENAGRFGVRGSVGRLESTSHVGMCSVGSRPMAREAAH